MISSYNHPQFTDKEGTEMLRGGLLASPWLDTVCCDLSPPAGRGFLGPRNHQFPSFPFDTFSSVLKIKVTQCGKKYFKWQRGANKRPHIVWFHLYKMSRTGKSTEKESRLVVGGDLT